MSKLEKARSLPGAEKPLMLVQSMADLQEQIAELQPQRQIQEALNQLRNELENIRSQHLDDLASRIEPLVQAMITLTAETRSTLATLQTEALKQQQATSASWGYPNKRATSRKWSNVGISELTCNRLPF